VDCNHYECMYIIACGLLFGMGDHDEFIRGWGSPRGLIPRARTGMGKKLSP
jgi:hypothetical protein